jgi:mRNA interferase MazF
MEIIQYSIILVNLDPAIGSEIRKTRPCVVISPDEMNKHLQTITIAPITTQSRNYPTRVEVKHNEQIGWVVLDQIRTIDKRRIIKIFGKLTDKEIIATKSIIRETFVD